MFLDDNMNQLSMKRSISTSNDNSTESDHISPLIKRSCSTSNSKLCLPLIDLISEECKSCGKQETLLKTINCPSLHCFCLNCIFKWTQKHVQTKTPPICLVVDCGYLLKLEDLEELPIGIKDHQILVQLIELKISPKSTNLRLKCDKCYLYIDQHNFFTHTNECSGRSLTIPCEICYCPVLMNDYEQHMLICTNDDNSTLSQFLFKHLQDPNIEEKNIKLFICSWQRKHRRTIDVYEMIEEFNQTNLFSNEICGSCKNTVRLDEFYLINCNNNHSLCLLCYKQHLQNQMNSNQILTCHQCDYHLQDKDLSEIRIFNNEQILTYQNYQNKKVLESYNNLYGTEHTFDINPTIGNPTTDDAPGRKCELCLKQHSYGNIFVLNCNCKICYDCFAMEVNKQRTTTNELIICSLCRSPIKENDLSNLRLSPMEIQMIKLYQQNKLFECEHAIHFNKQKSNPITNNNNDNEDDDDDFDISLLNQQQCLPKYWTLPMLANFSRHTLDPQSTEFKFVFDKFCQSWAHLIRNQRPPPSPVAVPPPVALQVPLRPPPSSSVASPVSLQMPLLPPPPSSSGVVPPTNNIQAAILQQYRAMQPSINNNMVPLTNHPTPPPTHGYGISPYSMPVGPNTMVPPPVPPLSLSRPPSIPLQQHMYPAMSPYVHTRAPTPMPTNNAVLPPSRRPRAVNAGNGLPKIIQIERIQNQRWYKQYSAHECEFRQKLGKQAEQWLFHGCDERSSKNIEVECFNRSYSGQHATAYGQGCYFARDSFYSHNYASPDRNGIRRMFLARVLVGKTAQGNSTMRVPPPGYDTTGDGQSIYVTYHDSQAYAEYLICYR